VSAYYLLQSLLLALLMLLLLQLVHSHEVQKK
jgi:hypothetical protein